MKYIFFFLFLCSSLSADPLHHRFAALKEKEVIVLDCHRSIWIICATKISPTQIHFQLLSATKDMLDRTAYEDWISWYEDGAPSSQSKEELIAPNNSYTDLEILPKARWLTTLWNLTLTPLSLFTRKRAGPKPHKGEHDFRPIWHPPIIVQGKRVETKSDAFFVQWPKDSSDLSGHKLILYFPESELPSQAFPYWIESEHGAYHIRVIDSKIYDTPKNLSNNDPIHP